MLRSMYSGIAGMKNFQTKLDVIGNNIANVNTVGFKKGRVTFQEMMSQTTSGAQGPTVNRGGMNAAQVGLGSQLGSIDDLHTQGFRQTTNIVLDIALQGDGMFVVATNTGRPSAEIEAAQSALETAKKELSTAQKTLDTAQGTLKAAQDKVTVAQKNLEQAESELAKLTTKLDAANAKAAVANTAYEAAKTAHDELLTPGSEKDAAKVVMEAADVVKKAADKVAKDLKEKYDDLEKKIGKAGAPVTATDDSGLTLALKNAEDALNKTGGIKELETIKIKDAEPKVEAAKASVTAAQKALSAELNWEVEVDGSFADAASISYTRAGNFYLDTDGAITNADGMYLVGFGMDEFGYFDTSQHSVITIPDDAESFSIQTDGVVNYIDSNGDPQVAGKIAIANFSNPAGLQKAGGNLYLNTPNAGLTGYVEGETNGSASLISGSLEMSNVDLAEEFTEMITAQRGFQANTRIISTSDEILQELVNLKR